MKIGMGRVVIFLKRTLIDTMKRIDEYTHIYVFYEIYTVAFIRLAPTNFLLFVYIYHRRLIVSLGADTDC